MIARPIRRDERRARGRCGRGRRAWPTYTAHWANTQQRRRTPISITFAGTSGIVDALGHPRARRRRAPRSRMQDPDGEHAADQHRARRRRRGRCRRRSGGAAAGRGPAGRASIIDAAVRRVPRLEVEHRLGRHARWARSTKLSAGAGDVVVHSRVWPSHGSSPAASTARGERRRSAGRRTPATVSDHQGVADGRRAMFHSSAGRRSRTIGRRPPAGRRSRRCSTAARRARWRASRAAARPSAGLSGSVRPHSFGRPVGDAAEAGEHGAVARRRRARPPRTRCPAGRGRRSGRARRRACRRGSSPSPKKANTNGAT